RGGVGRGGRGTLGGRAPSRSSRLPVGGRKSDAGVPGVGVGRTAAETTTGGDAGTGAGGAAPPPPREKGRASASSASAQKRERFVGIVGAIQVQASLQLACHLREHGRDRRWPAAEQRQRHAARAGL